MPRRPAKPPPSRARASAPERAAAEPRPTRRAARPEAVDSKANRPQARARIGSSAIESKATLQAGAPPDALARYHAKRDFRRTPEPAGAVAAAAGRRYVIHKHWATRLHYDLRLEFGGTMHSWAVPKGPSLDPHDKRLAVQVEDHPIAYNDFEGQIPAGQYGGGRVIIWDRGSWTPLGDPAQGLAAGNLKFELHGHKLQGRWALVRLKDGRAAKPQWLLIKEKDALARPASEYSVTEALPDSVGPAAAASQPDTILARTRREIAARRAEIQPHERAARASPARRATKHAAPPDTLAPQLASLAEAPPPDPEAWQWEMKFDGYRLLARADAAGAVRLITRNGLDWTARMPELARALSALGLPHSWLDGEVVMPGADELPDFAALQRAFDERRTRHLVYYLFDAPFLNGTDLRAAPLGARRGELEGALPPLADGGAVRLSGVLQAAPHSLLASACQLGLEGIIGKRLAAPYRSGRSGDWIKLKCAQEDEFVIAGFTAGQGAREASLGALVLAAHDAGGALRWAGNVGSGFSGDTLAALLRRLQPLAQAGSPLAPGEKVAGRVQWLRPRLVAQVRHAGLTPQGHVRHGVFRALREDKPAAEVVLPGVLGSDRAPAGADVALSATKKGARMASAKSVAFAGQTISSPDRVIDPSSGATKRDLARYYATVAPLVLPHLAQRPVALLRAPDGVAGEKFFQKHMEGRQLPGVALLDPALDPGHPALLEIADAAGLLGVVQMNAVELHTWNATHDRIERPDRFVLDLDPGEGVDWPLVQEAALLARTLLTELGLQPFLKTSGGKGLHLVTPIKRLYDWDSVKGFTRQLVEHLAALMPERFSALSGPRNRVGKIYPDYLRNGRGATTVCAWSARARPGLGISVPVAWDELDGLTSGAHWTLANIEQRLRLGNGPWQGYDAAARALGPAQKTLAAAGRG